MVLSYNFLKKIVFKNILSKSINQIMFYEIYKLHKYYYKLK